MLGASALVALMAQSYTLSAPRDRTSFAQQTVVDPATGQLLAAPASYANVGSPDRSAFAQQTTVDPATGEQSSAPASYSGVGTPDRSAFAQQTTIDPSSGEQTMAPPSYTGVGSADRGAFAQQTTVDPSSGEQTAAPGAYSNVGGADRTVFASQTTVDPATGEETAEPASYEAWFQHPVPDGSFGSPMRAARSGSTLNLTWDVTTCGSAGYHILFGNLASVASYAISGGVCGLGTGGSSAWVGAPGGNTWFLVVGNDQGGTEGTWGTASSGSQRAGTTPSNQCGNSERNNATTCP